MFPRRRLALGSSLKRPSSICYSTLVTPFLSGRLDSNRKGRAGGEGIGISRFCAVLRLRCAVLCCALAGPSWPSMACPANGGGNA